jgi:hypothetical protein
VFIALARAEQALGKREQGDVQEQQGPEGES